MKKEIALMAITALTLAVIQPPCLADDHDHDRNDWFARHDRDHDNKWNYREFHTANQYYWHHHHDEHPWKSTEYKTKWNTLHENGYVTREKVKELHHWD